MGLRGFFGVRIMGSQNVMGSDYGSNISVTHSLILFIDSRFVHIAQEMICQASRWMCSNVQSNYLPVSMLKISWPFPCQIVNVQEMDFIYLSYFLFLSAKDGLTGEEISLRLKSASVWKMVPIGYGPASITNADGQVISLSVGEQC